MGASYLNIHEIATPNKRFLGENGGRSVAMVARLKAFSCSVRSLLAKMPVRLLLMQKNSAKISKLFYSTHITKMKNIIFGFSISMSRDGYTAKAYKIRWKMAMVE